MSLAVLEHLDALQIEARQGGHDRQRQWRLIDINGDVRIRGERAIVETDAAKRIDRRRVRRGSEGECGSRRRQIGDRSDTLMGERLRTQRRTRKDTINDILTKIVGGKKDG